MFLKYHQVPVHERNTSSFTAFGSAQVVNPTIFAETLLIYVLSYPQTQDDYFLQENPDAGPIVSAI